MGWLLKMPILPERPRESQANFTLLLYSLGELDKGLWGFFVFFWSDDRVRVLSEPNKVWQLLLYVCCNDLLITARGSQMQPNLQCADGYEWRPSYYKCKQSGSEPWETSSQNKICGYLWFVVLCYLRSLSLMLFCVEARKPDQIKGGEGQCWFIFCMRILCYFLLTSCCLVCHWTPNGLLTTCKTALNFNYIYQNIATKHWATRTTS